MFVPSTRLQYAISQHITTYNLLESENSGMRQYGSKRSEVRGGWIILLVIYLLEKLLRSDEWSWVLGEIGSVFDTLENLKGRDHVNAWIILK